MIKMKFDNQEKEADDFVKEVASNPLLKDYDVNINNVNDFAILLEEHKNCEKCQGLNACKNSNYGHRLTYVEDQFLLEECKYKNQERLKNEKSSLINTLFVSKSILNADLADFEVNTPNRKKIYEYLLNFVKATKEKTFAKGLYIHGGFSTGKTFILGCIANELARNNISSLIIYFPDLVSELKNALGSARLEELINYLKSVDVLLIDDFGSENMTPWLRDEILGSVINYRLMEEKPIFISSNIDPNSDDFIMHLSMTKAPSELLKAERIKSRINGLTKNIELDNKGYFR